MRSPVTGIVALILLLLVAIVVYSSLFAVQQTEQALVVRFGKPVDIVTEPGLHVKAPFIDTVIPVDTPAALTSSEARPAAQRQEEELSESKCRPGCPGKRTLLNGMLICSSEEAIETFIAHCEIAARDLLLPIPAVSR